MELATFEKNDYMTFHYAFSGKLLTSIPNTKKYANPYAFVVIFTDASKFYKTMGGVTFSKSVATEVEVNCLLQDFWFPKNPSFEVDFEL